MSAELTKYRHLFGSEEQFSQFVQTTTARDEETRSLMSPPGELGLPDKLERARWRHGITDGAFKFQPVFDRVLVHQIDDVEDPTYAPGGMIVRPETAQQRGRESAPQGILVAAGLTALDALISNGIEVGDLVDFAFHAPLRKRVAVSSTGRDHWVILLQAGDIVGSADLRERLNTGECRFIYNQDEKKHFYIDRNGEQWTPEKPWLRGDW